MRARVDLVCVTYGDSAEEAAEKIRASRQAFLPVGKVDMDSADALLDSLDFFRLPPAERGNWRKSNALLRNVPFMPKQTTLNKALSVMREKKVLAAFVVDEYGGINGVISIQDIYSEVVGASVELTQGNTGDVKQIAFGQWVFDGTCTLDFIRENSAWRDCNLDGAYRAATFSGLFCEEYGCLPEPDTVIRIGNFRLKALSISKNRIDKILLSQAGIGREAGK